MVVNGRSRILEGGLYRHPALSRLHTCDLVGAIATRVSFHRNSGASPSLAAPPLRLTKVVAYHTDRLFPLGGRGKPGIMRGNFCKWFLPDLWG